MARRSANQAPPEAAPAAAPPAREPQLVVVINPYTVSLPWPPHYPRGGVGTVLFDDDPVLDTAHVPDDVAAEFQIVRASQAHKVAGAPEGAEVTPIRDPRLAAFYARLGYTRVPYANEPPAPKVPTPEIRTEPEQALSGDDLEVPPRDDVPKS